MPKPLPGAPALLPVGVKRRAVAMRMGNPIVMRFKAPGPFFDFPSAPPGEWRCRKVPPALPLLAAGPRAARQFVPAVDYVAQPLQCLVPKACLTKSFLPSPALVMAASVPAPRLCPAGSLCANAGRGAPPTAPAAIRCGTNFVTCPPGVEQSHPRCHAAGTCAAPSPMARGGGHGAK